jgi:hypothetical protein
MKKRNILISGVFILMILMTSSCKKWVNTDINNDPNKPIDVPMNLLLPTAEVGIAYQVGNDLGMSARLWMQQLAGASVQPQGFDNYVYTSSDADNTWKYGMYAAPLKDLYNLMQKAKGTETPSPAYAGISEVLMAYGMGLVTDLWGDAPYSDAFKGEQGIVQPTYDSQETLYNTIRALLDAAITDLNAAQTPIVAGTDDLIYGGDRTLWIRAAYTLKARYELHLAKKLTDHTGQYNLVLTDLAHGFTANTDDLQVPFGSNANENNPAKGWTSTIPDRRSTARGIRTPSRASSARSAASMPSKSRI